MRFTIFTLATLALIGCGKDGGEDTAGTTATTGTATGGTTTTTGTATGTTMTTGTPTTSTEPASIRVIHAGPDAPAVDVYVAGDSTPVFTNVAWGDTTMRLDVPAGAYTFELRAEGADPASAPAFTADLTVDADTEYTVIASGLLGSADPGESFRLLPFVDDFANAGAGEALVRIVHGSPTAPEVAVDVGDDGTPEIAALDTYADTGAAGVPLPSGTELQVAIWAGGNRVTAFTTPALADGGTYYVVASGLLESLPREDNGFSLLAVDDAGSIGFVKQNPVVQALHAGPDAPAVDLFAGTAELVDNLDFGELSGAIQVPPGSYTLDIHGTTPGNMVPAGAPAASWTTPTLDAGQRYLAIATGFLADTPAFTVIPVVDDFDLDSADALVQVVHASPDAPAVDVGTVANNMVTAVPDYTNLMFEDVSFTKGTTLPAGQYDLGIAATGTTAPLFTFSGVPFAGGDRVMAVAAGSVAAGSFELIAVDTTVFPWAAVEITPDP